MFFVGVLEPDKARLKRFETTCFFFLFAAEKCSSTIKRRGDPSDNYCDSRSCEQSALKIFRRFSPRRREYNTPRQPAPRSTSAINYDYPTEYPFRNDYHFYRHIIIRLTAALLSRSKFARFPTGTSHRAECHTREKPFETVIIVARGNIISRLESHRNITISDAL